MHDLMRLSPRLLAILALALITPVIASAGDAPAAPVAFDGAISSVPTGSCDAEGAEAVLEQPDFTPAGNAAVWTSHDGCHASLTCSDSNCSVNCSGTVCSTGSNYVECDGNRTYCPTCDVNQYPGYPTCAWRLCPWCVCISQGGTTTSCCSGTGW